MNKELIFKQITSNYLEKGTVTIENNKVILTLNKLVIESILNDISFSLKKDELKNWREDNKIIDFSRSQLYAEYCMELYTTLKATLDIAAWKNEITEEENKLFFSCLEFKIDEEIYKV